MSPSITVIIPTYNRAHELSRLLDQIIHQTSPPEQIIVVDDHSTDPTVKLLTSLVATTPSLEYFTNHGHYQRDAKRTGLLHATGDYLAFFDDDAVIDDPELFAKLRPRLRSTRIIQAKIILEQMGKINLPDLTLKDILATRPYPILELITTNLNRGTAPRVIFPLIEWGNFWHKSLREHFIDDHLIKDAYGESYSTSMKLRGAGVKLVIHPDLVIRHPGASQGGSHKFNKRAMTQDFTEFHYGYFYNMVYLHQRFWPGWIWLWLPFFYLKSIVALAINKNFTGWKNYALKPIQESLKHPHPNLLPIQGEGTATGKSAAGETPGVNGKTPGVEEAGRTNKSIFVWQGYWHGGAEYITKSAAHYFAKRGLDLTLGVYQRDPNISLKQIKFSESTWLPQSFRSLFSSLIWRYKHADKFDVVYAHTLGAWSTKHNHLFIHDAADLDTKLAQLTSLPYQLGYRVWRHLYLKLCLHPASGIFAATPEFANYLKHQGLPAKKISPSSSFYDDNIFKHTRRTRPTSIVNIIFIGNYLDPAKNFAAATKLVTHNPDYHLLVAGGAKQASKDSHITYLGYLSPPELFQQLIQAHIFLMPSLSEGFSVALLESLATGLPCLVNQAATPSPLAGVRNLIPYSLASDIPTLIQKIIKKYPVYNVFDPRLKQFGQSTVLHQEFTNLTSHMVLSQSESSL